MRTSGFQIPFPHCNYRIHKKNGVDAIELNLSYLSKKEYKNKECPPTLANTMGWGWTLWGGGGWGGVELGGLLSLKREGWVYHSFG